MATVLNRKLFEDLDRRFGRGNRGGPLTSLAVATTEFPKRIRVQWAELGLPLGEALIDRDSPFGRHDRFPAPARRAME